MDTEEISIKINAYRRMTFDCHVMNNKQLFLTRIFIGNFEAI